MSRLRFAVRRCALMLMLLPVAFAAAQAAGAPDVDKVNGSITAAAGQEYGRLETVNGGIDILAGARTGDAETVNGSIRVAGRARTGGLSTVNGAIRLGPQVQVGKGLETVNGGIFVGRGGRVGGDIRTVNGAIGVVGSAVAGGIATVGGDITVGVGSRVKGGIKVDKPNNGWLSIRFGKRRPPHIVVGPDAVVEGALVFERTVVLHVSASARTGPVSGATALRFDGARAPQD